MGINYAHISERKIMMDVGDGSNLKVAAKTNLENLGHVRSHYEFVNDSSHLERMKKYSELDLSLGLVRNFQNNES